MKNWKKIAYAAGSLGTALSYQAFNNRIQFLYIDEIGLDAGLIGIIWLFYGLWNAINDPLMGQLSDNTRTRFGRRIPYIAFASLPMAVFFVLMWLPPREADTWLLVAYFGLTIFVFDTLWSLVVLSWTALFPEMVSDLDERADISAWRQVFSIIGLILALSLTPIVIDNVGWLGMALIFGVVTLISFWVSLLGSRERPELSATNEKLSLGTALRVSIENKSFRWFLLANLAKEFIFNIVVAMLPFYAKYVLRLEGGGALDAATQEALLLGVPFILAIPAMYVWTKITQRIGSRRAWIYASLAFVPGLIVIMLASDFTVGIIGTCLLVLGLPGLLMLSDLLISDVIDEDELVVGYRREGMFFGVNGAIIRLAFSIEAILISTVLPLTGYIAGAAVQPASAVMGFRFLMAGAPLLAVVVTIIALRHYPLHGEQLRAVREQIDRRHAERAAAAALALKQDSAAAAS